MAVLQGQKVKALELAYTALARMAAANGDGDAAVKAAEEGLRAGVPARLRTFVPALLAYAVAGDVDKAFQVCWLCTCLVQVQMQVYDSISAVPLLSYAC